MSDFFFLIQAASCDEIRSLKCPLNPHTTPQLFSNCQEEAAMLKRKVLFPGWWHLRLLLAKCISEYQFQGTWLQPLNTFREGPLWPEAEPPSGIAHCIVSSFFTYNGRDET